MAPPAVTSRPCLGTRITVKQALLQARSQIQPTLRLSQFDLTVCVSALPSYALTTSAAAVSPHPSPPRNVSVHGELFLFFSYINAMK